MYFLYCTTCNKLVQKEHIRVYVADSVIAQNMLKKDSCGLRPICRAFYFVFSDL